MKLLLGKLGKVNWLEVLLGLLALTKLSVRNVQRWRENSALVEVVRER